MKLSPQIRMVNDIAVQFQHRPPEEAADTVAAHLKSFWEPRMLAELRQLAHSIPDEFDPVALAAAHRLD